VAIYYTWVPQLLPFEWASHIFMQNALLAVLLVTPLFGILGTMVVNNKMAFFSDALGHSALTGIAIGVILGMSDPLWAMLAFSILLALGISIVKASTTSSPDTIIGVFSATAVALGIVILSRAGGFTKYSRYLIGDLLSITPNELLMLVFLVLGVLVFWGFMFNQLLLVSINSSLARSRGSNVQLLEILFSIIMAVIVTISIQWVGLLIINSLLILPAASARNISRDMRQYHFFSVSIALLSGLTGLLLSYYWGTATGATIVLCSAAFFLLTLLIKFRSR
jgi:zinc transport system permease protein